MEDKDFIIYEGSEGTFKPLEKYNSEPQDVDGMIAAMRQKDAKKITLYFHGGLVDEENGDFYYKFVAGMFGTETYLQKIDLKTGRMTSSQRISSATVHKIRIMSGYVYYTISDKDPNKMYIEQLFRQKL